MSGPGVAMSASEAITYSAMFVSCSMAPSLLFHRHALGEVARLVHITTAVFGDTVSEELERHAAHERAKHLRRPRDGEHGAATPAGGQVVLAGYRNNVGAAGDGLLDVGERLLSHEALAQDGHYGAALVHEGYGPVLHLAGRMALRGEVGDLLELQSPLERHRMRWAAPEKERAPRLLEEAGCFLYPPLEHPEDLIDLLRRPAQIPPEPQEVLLRRGLFLARQLQGQQVQGRDLGEEGLGRGDPDLRPCPGEQHGVGLPRYERALRVGYRESPPAEPSSRLDSRQGVGRLPTLGDGDDEGLLVADRIRVTVLASNGDLDGETGQALDGVLAEQASVVGRAARDDRDPLEARELQIQLREVNAPPCVEPPGEGRLQGGGLLVDLFEHVVLEPTELYGLGLPVHRERLAPDRLAFKGKDADGRARNLHYLAVLHDQKLPGLPQQGLHRARQKALTLPHSHDQRALVPGRHDLPRLVPAHRRDRE